MRICAAVAIVDGELVPGDVDVSDGVVVVQRIPQQRRLASLARVRIVADDESNGRDVELECDSGSTDPAALSDWIQSVREVLYEGAAH